MSLTYQAISFNKQKKIYDRYLLLGLCCYFTAFGIIQIIFFPESTPETFFLRSTSTAGFLLMHVILCIGPLTRLCPAFLPLLYNRRHLGVAMFLLALLHALFAIMLFHGGGDANPLLSLFLSNTDYLSLANFPFQVLGFLALLILLFMAATSHDFWLANLGPVFWKSLHMLVYLAYALTVMHVALGELQSETNPLLIALLSTGLILVIGLHLASALRSDKKIIYPAKFDREGYAYVCKLGQMQDNRAKILQFSKERVAVFLYGNKLSAVSNVCRHQNGPLGEGKVIDGCITCPWHGYQYLPHNGTSPPPFNEKIDVFQVKLENGRVYVHPKSFPGGTEIEPVLTDSDLINV